MNSNSPLFRAIRIVGLRLFLLMVAFFLASGCAARRDSASGTRVRWPDTGVDHRLANLERAARYPWTDDGRCVVQEAFGDWATLVERCYDALDRSRIRFVDEQGVCPIAQVGAISAEDVTRLVGICMLIQPEIAVGAVIVIGAVVVAVAISAEIEAARAKKPGCYCKCFRENDGVYPEGRVNSPAECADICQSHARGPMASICK